MKACSSSYFSSLATVAYSPSICLYGTNFRYEGGHSITHSILKTFLERREDQFGLFLNTNIRSGRSKNAYQIDCSCNQFRNIQV